MINSEDFIKRLEKILKYYSLSASGFADKIDVQRSSISHLLSGRNRPSLDLVLKINKSFPEVNLYWLLNGKGTFPAMEQKDTTPTSPTPILDTKDASPKKVKKVIIFYSDGTFDTYDKN